MSVFFRFVAIFHIHILQAYLYLVVSGYGSSQRDDHRQYYSLYSLNAAPHSSFLPANESIGMRNMGQHDDAWDTRDSMDTVGFEKQYANQQQYPAQQAYPVQAYPPPQRQPSGGMTYPNSAMTMDPQPTPYHSNYSSQYEDPYYSAPAPATRHPGQ